MNRGPGPEGPRGRGVPTWAMVFVALVLLGGAAWLFLVEPATQQPPVEQSRQDDDAGGGRDRDGDGGDDGEVERELQLPDQDEDGGDEARDGDTERGEGPSGDGADERDLPPAYGALRGRSVALGTGAYTTTGTGPLTRRVGGLAAPCDPDPDPTEELRALEAQVRDELATVLRRAQAKVLPVATTGPCAALRANDLHAGDHAIVIRVVDGAATRVLRARPARRVGKASLDASATLATELAGALELRGVVSATSAKDRATVMDAGAIDLPDGSTLAVVELGSELLGDDQGVEDVVTHLADALAAVSARADVPAAD